jgi:hypothetical protein
MKLRKAMRGIVVENRVSMKATLARGAENPAPYDFRLSTGASGEYCSTLRPMTPTGSRRNL